MVFVPSVLNSTHPLLGVLAVVLGVMARDGGVCNKLAPNPAAWGVNAGFGCGTGGAGSAGGVSCCAGH